MEKHKGLNDYKKRLCELFETHGIKYINSNNNIEKEEVQNIKTIIKECKEKIEKENINELNNTVLITENKYNELLTKKIKTNDEKKVIKKYEYHKITNDIDDKRIQLLASKNIKKAKTLKVVITKNMKDIKNDYNKIIENQENEKLLNPNTVRLFMNKDKEKEYLSIYILFNVLNYNINNDTGFCRQSDLIDFFNTNYTKFLNKLLDL